MLFHFHYTLQIIYKEFVINTTKKFQHVTVVVATNYNHTSLTTSCVAQSLVQTAGVLVTSLCITQAPCLWWGTKKGLEQPTYE